MAKSLNEVFGIATRVNAASYVDRGGLDDRLRYYLGADRHVAIHGDSKQGKSWLRSNVLNAQKALVVQCGVESTPESLFREALGQLDVYAELRRTGTSQIEGHLDFTGSGQLGHFLVGKASAEIEAGGTGTKTSQVDTQPIGQTPGDLSWISRILRASGKKLVIEDFHYVSEANRRAFSFMLKALGDYEVYVIVAGVWPEDHLLTYYNGDLDGRVEDIRLVWDDEALKAVLDKGCQALNIQFTEGLKSALVKDAYGNVGLLQRLAEHMCLAAGVLQRQDKRKRIDVDGCLHEARATVSRDMKARYDAFADNFVRGMKRITESLEVYKHMLRAVTNAEAKDLLEGIDSRDLLRRIEDAKPQSKIRQSDLTQALDRVDRLQTMIGVRPQVLTYNRDRRRLFLADRSYLFYRDYGSPTWPWDKDESLREALDAVQLNLEDVEIDSPVAVGAPLDDAASDPEKPMESDGGPDADTH